MVLGVATLACMTSVPSTQAQPIYRCGPEGRSYSHTPCTQGRTVEVADDTPGPHRQDAARAVVRSEQALGDRMERERLAREARERQTGAVHIGRGASPRHEPQAGAKRPGSQNAKKEEAKRQGRAAHRDEFRAVVPAGG